jgi:riboflavin synthase
MFTGIIEEVGLLKSINNKDIQIQAKKILEDVKIGDSISINGACLTVTKVSDNILTFHVSSTTENLSNFKIGKMRIGDEVNLERAVTPLTRLGGHIVSGHIDGTLKIISIRKSGEDTFFEFLFSKEFKSLIIPKGSITIDGISLTISKVMSSSFIITVIPQTITETNLKNKRTGDFVHFEIDIFARYVKHILNYGGNDGSDNRFIEKFF